MFYIGQKTADLDASRICRLTKPGHHALAPANPALPSNEISQGFNEIKQTNSGTM